MSKKSIHKEDITDRSIYTPNKGTSKTWSKNWQNWRIDNSTITEDSKTLLSIMNRQ